MKELQWLKWISANVCDTYVFVNFVIELVVAWKLQSESSVPAAGISLLYIIHLIINLWLFLPKKFIFIFQVFINTSLIYVIVCSF